MDAFRVFRPGFDLAAERVLREAAGVGELIEDRDLYPDVRSGLAALRRAGVWVGVAGNQTARAAELLRGLGLPVDEIATSGEWGVSKPDQRFFARVRDMPPDGRGGQSGPGGVVYVGDHRDMDVLPAKKAGLRTVLIRRGPWGRLWAQDPDTVAHADWVIDSLDELAGLLADT